MKHRDILLPLAAAAFLGLSALGAAAHSEKETTTPADGAVLETAPDTLGMTFDRPMRLTLVRLSDSAGAEYEVTRSDGMAPVTAFEAAPAMLGPGSYTLEWRGLSDDGHAMQGSFSFEIRD